MSKDIINNADKAPETDLFHGAWDIPFSQLREDAPSKEEVEIKQGYYSVPKVVG